MSKSLYIAATEARSGKSAIVLGVMHLLMSNLHRVAVFRPVISDPLNGGRDHDIDLMLRHFKLDQPYERTYGYTLSEARSLINSGNKGLLLENTLNKFKELEKEYDFVLCEGTDYIGGNATLEFEINASIVSNMGCPVLVVVNGKDKADDELCGSAQRTVELFEGARPGGHGHDRQPGAPGPRPLHAAGHRGQDPFLAPPADLRHPGRQAAGQPDHPRRHQMAGRQGPLRPRQAGHPGGQLPHRGHAHHQLSQVHQGREPDHHARRPHGHHPGLHLLAPIDVL